MEFEPPKFYYFFIFDKTLSIDDYEMTNIFLNILDNIFHTVIQTQKHKRQWNLISSGGQSEHF